MPALFTLAGVGPREACVIEAIGQRRRVHDAAAEGGCTTGIANDWLSGDLPGMPRAHALEPSAATVGPRENNRMRRSIVCALQRTAFAGAADLVPPVINSHTFMMVRANERDDDRRSARSVGR